MNYPHHDAPNGERINYWQKHIPVISTSHITKEDGLHIGELGIDVYSDRAACLLKTEHPNPYGHTWSAPLYSLLQAFRELGYRWIILDRDGDVLKDFPTFEWK